MADKVAQACDAATEKIDLVLQRLMVLEMIVTNQLSEQKPVVEDALRLVLAAMRDLDSSASSLSEVEIPSKLLQWLDEGKDPDGFFKMLFDDTIWAGQVSLVSARTVTGLSHMQVLQYNTERWHIVQVMKGKLDAIASGRQGLEKELQAAPPVGDN